jgi:outer membrane protein OmpA-like peptidoglycan-associated protein
MHYAIRSPIAAFAVIAMMSVGFTGCQALTRTQQGAVIGATTGAAVGGAIGSRHGNTAMGAIIGAAVGGAAGAAIGRRMDQQAAELEATIPGASVERISITQPDGSRVEGIIVTFASGILFPFDSSDILPAGRDNLRNLASSMHQFPGHDVMIVGHTDNVGTASYNQGLSERRAMSARNLLVAQGVPSHRIQTVGRGMTEPIASNETESGRQQNRRVEIAIFPGPDAR